MANLDNTIVNGKLVVTDKIIKAGGTNTDVLFANGETAKIQLKEKEAVNSFNVTKNNNNELFVYVPIESIRLGTGTENNIVLWDKENKIKDGPGIKNNTKEGSLELVDTSLDGNFVPTINTIAYWNGAYSNTTSNLTYSANGEILGTDNIDILNKKGTKEYNVKKNSDGKLYVHVPWEVTPDPTGVYLPLIGGTMSGNITVSSLSDLGDYLNPWNNIYVNNIESQDSGSLHILTTMSGSSIPYRDYFFDKEVVVHCGEEILGSSGSIRSAGNISIGNTRDTTRKESFLRMYSHDRVSDKYFSSALIPLAGDYGPTGHYLPNYSGLIAQNKDFFIHQQVDFRIYEDHLQVSFPVNAEANITLELQLWDYGHGRNMFYNRLQGHYYYLKNESTNVWEKENSTDQRFPAKGWRTVNEKIADGTDSDTRWANVIRSLQTFHAINKNELIDACYSDFYEGCPWQEITYRLRSKKYITKYISGYVNTLQDLSGHLMPRENQARFRIKITQNYRFGKVVYYSDAYSLDYNHSLDKSGMKIRYKDFTIKRI